MWLGYHCTISPPPPPHSIMHPFKTVTHLKTFEFIGHLETYFKLDNNHHDDDNI